jgi:nanoRNase/pAp phosphatase (c-di-AMP/oligoRNAs hydrolase)
VNKRFLGEIEHPLLARDYFRLVGHAVHSAVLYEDVVVTILESVPYSEAVAEVADFLMRLESATWSLCVAPHAGHLHISLRTRDTEATAGLLLASILPSGMAGGHGMMAGGKIKTSQRTWKDEASKIVQDFLEALGKSKARPQPLM